MCSRPTEGAGVGFNVYIEAHTGWVEWCPPEGFKISKAQVETFERTLFVFKTSQVGQRGVSSVDTIRGNT